ncbi:MAG TPA: SOS response-associated peptidase [Thiotrichaceae bacterium]|jgi:putative SOS response-associated peptidase YedK|nr:SOS response-associated peptidase [Thiotrichaceae bacterium]HIM08788.1 SOS response-associated peptidase [Gammaproteobacteria bacterium]
MYGRFYLKNDKANIAKQFSVGNPLNSKTSYNITPSQNCTVVRLKKNESELANLSWGLVPSWAKSDVKIKPINAKAETIKEKPYFRSAYKKQRCIIPASGFYEWKGSKGNKQPYCIYPLNDPCFGFAGLWEKRNELETFTIITTAANELMSEVHHRMPVILDSKDYDTWLKDGDYKSLKPCASEEMGMHMVSSAVNKPSNNGAELITPVGL